MVREIFSIDNMISEVSKRPALWNKHHIDNSNKGVREELWREICSALFPNWEYFDLREKLSRGEQVQKKWRNLKDCFRREIKQQMSSMYGSGNKLKRKYVHFDQLSFLLPVIDDKFANESFDSPSPSIHERDEECSSTLIKNEHLDEYSPDENDTEDILTQNNTDCEISHLEVTQSNGITGQASRSNCERDGEFLRALGERGAAEGVSPQIMKNNVCHENLRFEAAESNEREWAISPEEGSRSLMEIGLVEGASAYMIKDTVDHKFMRPEATGSNERKREASRSIFNGEGRGPRVERWLGAKNNLRFEATVSSDKKQQERQCNFGNDGEAYRKLLESGDIKITSEQNYKKMIMDKIKRNNKKFILNNRLKNQDLFSNDESDREDSNAELETRLNVKDVMRSRGYENNRLNISSDSKREEIDEDKYFLLSLLPALRSLPVHQKFDVKMGFLQILQQATCTSADSKSSSQ
ncbi:hypothetical protein QYM36_016120 [Artemia franciscana]|uniref:MADF domain-containing protein n=3 Tax=Artemia franciscana TaxID=6661 RepID=A0AA88KTE8_ARTSF|nr:hypothetical protein QYM36_016120 [Artemia franciscana]